MMGDLVEEWKESLIKLLSELEAILGKNAKDLLEDEDYYFMVEKCLIFDSVVKRVKKMMG